MGLIDIIKSLSTVLSSAVNKSQQPPEKNMLGTPRIRPGAVGCKARRLSNVQCSPPKWTTFAAQNCFQPSFQDTTSLSGKRWFSWVWQNDLFISGCRCCRRYLHNWHQTVPPPFPFSDVFETFWIAAENISFKNMDVCWNTSPSPHTHTHAPNPCWS